MGDLRRYCAFFISFQPHLFLVFLFPYLLYAQGSGDSLFYWPNVRSWWGPLLIALLDCLLLVNERVVTHI
uniref:Uncharacterized protein n=1 Tax=Rhizophora mucronata TaxID=61149 RepID=A0A2P2PM96_RHIMU